MSGSAAAVRSPGAARAVVVGVVQEDDVAGPAPAWTARDRLRGRAPRQSFPQRDQSTGRQPRRRTARRPGR